MVERLQQTLKREKRKMLLLETMRKIEIGADRGALVTIRDLRNAGIKDSDILTAARYGLIVLHASDIRNAENCLEVDGISYIGAAIPQR